MSNNFKSIISQDWDNLAIDDGTFIDEFGSYFARIHPRRDSDSIIETQVDNISYSPEVNSVPGMTIDVEPKSEFESEHYLGSIVDIFLNRQPLFSGEVYKIETHQNDDGFYTLRLEPPGKKLRNESINVQTDNYIVNDFMAKIVDKYNGWDDEHFNLEGTSQESLSNITESGRTRVSDSDGATATYSNVGSDASNISTVYIKAKTPNSNTSVSVDIQTSSSSYSNSFSDLTEGTFGQWVELNPDNLASESYDIQFTLDNDSTLYDWIVLTGDKLQRTVEPAVEGTSEVDKEIESASTQTEFENLVSSQLSETDPIDISNGELVQDQTAFVHEAHETFSGVGAGEVTRSDFSDGEGRYISRDSVQSGNSLEWFSTIDYTLENATLYFRSEIKANGDDAVLPGIDISVDNETINSISDGATVPEDSSPGWHEDYLAVDPDVSQIPDSVSGDVSIKIEVTSATTDFDSISYADGYAEWEIDVICLADNRYDYNFDNSLNTSSGYLDGPELYPKTDVIPTLQFPENVLGQMITSGKVNLSTNRSSGAGSLEVSFDSGGTYFGENDASNIDKDNPATTSSILSRIGFSGWESNGARSQTPREGYGPQKVSSYELLVDTSSLEILYGQDYNGNRLKVLSDVADNSSTYFRWEGNNCRIFNRGDKTTDVDLRKEEIQSSVDIEDVYSSCEVFGKNGVSSGVIESPDAPDFVDRHKEINDPEIQNEQDAKRKANSFLAEHAEINYTGSIETLPTLAPLGEELDGSMFNHGENMHIESVSYGKRRSSIECGRSKRIRDEILKLDRKTESSSTRDTRS